MVDPPTGQPNGPGVCHSIRQLLLNQLTAEKVVELRPYVLGITHSALFYYIKNTAILLKPCKFFYLQRQTKLSYCFNLSANSLVIPFTFINSSISACFIFSTLPNCFNKACFLTLPIPLISSNADFVISLSLNFL